MKKISMVLLLGLSAFNLLAAGPEGEIISFRCGLAIDAVIAELDTQASNEVTQEAMSKIDETNGEFVCIPVDDSKIFVRLQSKVMSATDNRLLFTVNTQTYRVIKTLYGR